MSGWLYLAIAIIAEVIATTALKSSDGMSRLVPALIVVCGYAIAFFCLSLTMRHIPMGLVYAIWSGVGVVLITIAGWLLFGEKLDLAAMLGMALIVSGVLVLNLLSGSASH